MLAGGSWDQTPSSSWCDPEVDGVLVRHRCLSPREVSMSAKRQLVLANRTPSAVLFSTCQIPLLFLKEGYTQNRG